MAKKNWKPKVEYRDPSTLVPYAKNAKIHSSTQIDKVAGAIAEFGFTQPIVVDASGVIIAGHCRREASIKLGLKEVPVVVADHLDEYQVMAARIADNKIAESPWDPDLLKFDLGTLKMHDFKIELTGFEVPEIESFLNDGELPDIRIGSASDGAEDAPVREVETSDPEKDDAVPETPTDVITKFGDVWQLGEHRLMCGSATVASDVDTLMNGEKADMVFTDPPYGINVVKADGNIGGERVGKNGFGEKGQYDKKAKCGTYKPIIGDDKPFDPTFLLDLAPTQIIWGANHFASRLPDSSHWIVWYKEMPVGTDFSGAELAWTSIDKKAVKTYKFTWAGMTREGNRKDELSNRVHPTQKPVGLFEQILNDYDPKSVIDLFGGSGSTLIACEKTNRKCFMMELSPEYCDVIVARWEEYTGLRAVLLPPRPPHYRARRKTRGWLFCLFGRKGMTKKPLSNSSILSRNLLAIRLIFLI
jgi:16S rRNA G966 N2-methylase RsmD